MKDFVVGDKVRCEVLKSGRPRWDIYNDRGREDGEWAEGVVEQIYGNRLIVFFDRESGPYSWEWLQPSIDRDVYQNEGYLCLMSGSVLSKVGAVCHCSSQALIGRGHDLTCSYYRERKLIY